MSKVAWIIRRVGGQARTIDFAIVDEVVEWRGLDEVAGAVWRLVPSAEKVVFTCA